MHWILDFLRASREVLEEWVAVPDGQETDFNFFKVTVELP